MGPREVRGRAADLALLQELQEREDLPHNLKTIFGDMEHRLHNKYERLTKKQRAFAEAVAEGRRYEPPEEYLNIASEGVGGKPLARGKEVELMVKDKPLRPPTRKAAE